MQFIFVVIFLGFVGNIVGLYFGINWLINPDEGEPQTGIIVTVSTVIGTLVMAYVLTRFFPYSCGEDNDSFENRNINKKNQKLGIAFES